MMTFDELKRRLDRSSDDDRRYSLPIDWAEAEELLMVYEELKKLANYNWKRGYEQGKNDPDFLDDTDDE